MYMVSTRAHLFGRGERLRAGVRQRHLGGPEVVLVRAVQREVLRVVLVCSHTPRSPSVGSDVVGSLKCWLVWLVQGARRTSKP
jgi:hypothetical protein